MGKMKPRREGDHVVLRVEDDDNFVEVTMTDLQAAILVSQLLAEMRR